MQFFFEKKDACELSVDKVIKPSSSNAVSCANVSTTY